MRLLKVSLVYFCFVFSTVVFAEEQWKVHSFSATQVAFETVLPKKIATSKVYASAIGIRVEGMQDPNSPIKNMTSIFRFKENQTWLIDPVQKAYIVLDNETADMVEDEYAGGILATQPCEEFTQTKKLGQVSFQERQVEKWQCDNPAKKIKVLQLYDANLGVVVHENIDGKIVELRKIKPGSQSGDLFQAPKDFRRMSLVEMLTGYVELPKYKE
jgi:hypothetical protein